MDVEYQGRAAYLPAADALVLADLHIGRASASNVEAPLADYDGMLDRLGSHLSNVDPTIVVIAGDLLHVHGSIPAGAREVLDGVVGSVLDTGASLVLVRGNHDTLLDHVELPEDVVVTDEHRLDDGTLVCHGHEEPASEAPGVGSTRYVIGHEHPAIRVEGARHPCFLYGKGVYRDADVLVLPAFSHVASGTLVNGRSSAMSPLIGDLGAFAPVIVGEEAYAFPPLAELSDLL